MKTVFILQLFIFVFYLSMCTYKKPEEVKPVASCDTTTVSYVADIKPVIEQQCTGCHSGANAAGSINLSVFAQLQRTATTGLLFQVVNHTKGYPPMPANQPKLSDCLINKIQRWGLDGAPNN